MENKRIIRMGSPHIVKKVENKDECTGEAKVTIAKVQKYYEAKIEEARRGESERILNYLKGLLKSTPKASLAATIGLIESNEESRSLRTQPITDKVFSAKDLEKLLEEAESKGFDDCLNLIIGADDNALTRKIKPKIEEAKKQLIAKVNRYFETEPWMTQEDWEALKSTEEGGRK